MQETLSSSRAVVRSGLFNLLGFGASVLYMIILVPLVVGYVGVEQYGIWTLITALTGYLGLADLGMGTSFVPHIARFAALEWHDEVNKVIQHGLLFYAGLSVLVFGVGWGLSPWLFSLVRVPAEYTTFAETLLVIALAGFCVASVSGVFGSVLTALQRMDVYNSLLAATFAAKLAVITLLLVLGHGLVGMMLADLAVAMFSLVPIIALTRRNFPHLRFRWIGYDPGLLRRLLSFGTQLQVSRIAEAVQSQFDKLVLSRFVGLSAVSLYDFGARPGIRLRTLPLTAISSLIPAVSALDAADNRERIQAALIRSTRYLAIVALPMFAFFVAFAEDVVTVWLGPGFGQAAMTLRVLSAGYAVAVVTSAMSFISQGKREPQVQMWTTSIQAVLNVILSVTLVRMFGFFGAAVGTSISAVAGSIVIFQWYGRCIVDRPMAILRRLVAKPLLSLIPAIALAGATSWGGKHLLGISSRGGLCAMLAAEGLIILVLYAATIVRLKAVTSDDRAFIEGVMPGRLRFLLRYI